jgi:hypothetical protein
MHKNISKQYKVLVSESEDSPIHAPQSRSQGKSEDFSFPRNREILSNIHPKVRVLKNSRFFETLLIPMHFINLLRWRWAYSIVKKNISIIAWVGRFKKNPKILLSTWNSKTMSDSLPKKQIFHHLIASRNAYHLPKCIPNLCNPIFIQSEDCLNAVLLRALQEKPEDSSFHMKQQNNVRFTSEEANFPPSHCFAKCALFMR